MILHPTGVCRPWFKYSKQIYCKVLTASAKDSLPSDVSIANSSRSGYQMSTNDVWYTYGIFRSHSTYIEPHILILWDFSHTDAILIGVKLPPPRVKIKHFFPEGSIFSRGLYFDIFPENIKYQKLLHMCGTVAVNCLNRPPAFIIIIIIISLTSIFFQDKSRVWMAASQQH